MPPFSPAGTLLCTVLLALVGIPILCVPAQGGPDPDVLDQPMALAAQYFDRELEMADASSRTPAWARPLQRLATSPATDVRDEVIRELGAVLEAHAQGTIEATPVEVVRVEGRLALVLAETDKRDLLRARLDTLAARGSEGARLAALVRFAYGLSDERPSEAALEEVLALLRDEARPGPTWATDRLASRVLRRLGNEADASAAEARLLDRGGRAQTRALWLGGILVALVLAGLAVGAPRLVSRKPLPRLSSGVSPAPWSAAEGYAMTVRAGVLCLLVLVAYYLLLELLVSDFVAKGLPFGTLLGALPMLHYLTRRVPAAHGTRLVELFGLRLEAPATDLFVATLVLIALEQALGMGASALSPGHWYEGVLEEALRGGPGQVLVLTVDAVIWAPLLEEIACRGLIYTSLRTRLSPWNAAMASAALFTLPHMYSPGGALALFTGAIASALIYERTRSLLPCIVAHAVNNALAMGASLLVYRG
ncbi:CPBP family intramembrane glutamic endopeptidase [Archangium sp.]|uniref:CPBP family intramembrane glutamic endopeptidase n=1 Tax=Archangium sp. TaxID=1872627 RepID=UPI002ED894DB